MTKKDIVSLIENDPWMMDILRTVEDLNLNDWMIGAGFVRSTVWDHLHKYVNKTLIPDIDLIYFNLDAKKIEDEKIIWKKLKEKYPTIKWSVTNIAYRHLKLHREPYKNSTQALSEWVETATCVAVKTEKGKVTIIAPHTVKDLVNLTLRPTPKFKNDLKTFYQRIENKEWLKKWPKLKIDS